MTVHYERITNLLLLRNNLYHIGFELDKANPSFVRIGKESHLTLYRAMVEALRGSANISITGRPRNKKHETVYKIGDQPYYKIEKEIVKDCKHAWRFSSPIICPEPKYEKANKNFNDLYNFDDYLKSFYELLAMIQTDCFMIRYCYSKPVHVTDKEMKFLEWLHERIRNEYEHFIPKDYSVAKYDLKVVSLFCLEITNKLLYESGNVYDHPRGIKTNLLKAIRKFYKFKLAYEMKYL
jgi:hypothetical protein